MRIGLFASVALGGLLLTGGTALADDAAVPSGIELGLRTGYAFALGSAAGGANGASGANMSDFIGGAVPIWIDAGYRLASPNLFIGAYFQYGIGFVSGQTANQTCSNGVSCSAYVMQYGIQAHYHFMPDNQFDPWVGYGIGMEQAQVNLSQGGQSGSINVNGWDYGIIQVGADYRGLLDGLGVGPLVMFGFGQYSNESTSPGGQSGSIPNQAMHEWLTIGIRGVYDIKI
jgi:hypothetical protein